MPCGNGLNRWPLARAFIQYALCGVLIHLAGLAEALCDSAPDWWRARNTLFNDIFLHNVIALREIVTFDGKCLELSSRKSVSKSRPGRFSGRHGSQNLEKSALGCSRRLSIFSDGGVAFFGSARHQNASKRCNSAATRSTFAISTSLDSSAQALSHADLPKFQFGFVEGHFFNISNPARVGY